MQRRERHERPQTLDDLGRDHDRALKLRAAVDHAMPDTDDAPTLMLLAQPGGQDIERASRVSDGIAERFVGEGRAVAVLRGEARRCADALNLSAARQPPGVARRPRVGAEFQARRAGVQYDNKILHCRSPITPQRVRGGAHVRR